jgi:proliferating cell nuclear antigen
MMVLSTEDADALHVDFVNTNTNIVLASATNKKKTKKQKEKEEEEKEKENKKEDKPFEKQFKIPLTEYESEMMSVPETDYDVDITLPAKKLQELTHQLALFGDTLLLACSDESIVLTSEDGSQGKMNVTVPIEDVLEFSICEGETIQSSFGLAILNKICVHTKLTEHVMLSMKQDFPMRLRYQLCDQSFIQFYIAPKVTDS